MKVTKKDLKPFQEAAASKLAAMIIEYPNEKFQRFDPATGDILPFLCRLRAITGAGKTPILALTSSYLKDGIILWTTNRGAIISQTLENLRPGGKYSELLPEGTDVFSISEMSHQDWQNVSTDTSKLTILVATVASFNREGDVLRIHQPAGDTTPWETLGGKSRGGRRRQLYVFYDEGHGATERQFLKLRELNPKALLLASASPLPDDLSDLLSGRTVEARKQSLEDRTVVVPTKLVVKAGLLKGRLYFSDCDIAQIDALKEANDKWKSLALKLRRLGKTPIACFIVNDTQRGVGIWQNLVKLGVPKAKIAVHLNRAKDVICELVGSEDGLIDTYTGKSAPDRSPLSLSQAGFSHIIWNMTLREGWDEPFAYVGYIDNRGKSRTDITQKIGRFVRQPDAKPFDDPDLNAAYFYLNVPDNEFSAIIKQTQKEMEDGGHEVIAFRGAASAPLSREVEPKFEAIVPSFGPTFGHDIRLLDNVLLGSVPLFADSALKAKGKITKRVLNLRTLKEEEKGANSESREYAEEVRVWDYLATKLSSLDPRIMDEGGTRFSAELRNSKRMQQKMHNGCEAMRHVESQVESIQHKLDELFHLENLGKHGLHKVEAFRLITPNIRGVTERLQAKYKVHQFKNAVHGCYNGLNPFETQVALSLDILGLAWCRNPSSPTGYKLPIPTIASENLFFYPDFILWGKKFTWLLEPKGLFLLGNAVAQKLFELEAGGKGQKPVRLAFLVEGGFSLGTDGRWVRSGIENEYTLIQKKSGTITVVRAQDVQILLSSLV